MLEDEDAGSFCLPTIPSRGATGKSIRNAAIPPHIREVFRQLQLESRATICARSVSCKVGPVTGPPGPLKGHICAIEVIVPSFMHSIIHRVTD